MTNSEKPDQEEILATLKGRFNVPGGMEICTDAMRVLLGDNADNQEWIKANFSTLVNDIQIAAYERYLSLETPAAAYAIRRTFSELLPANASAEDLFKVIEENIWVFDRFFLGLTQGRRPRAGKAFEQIITVLFNTLGYPYTPQPIINGQPDFLLPNEEHYGRNAMDCIIFTVKRTLRERWRQIITEGTRGHMFFLATIDENVAARDLPEMLASRIYLVMPEKIRAEFYPSEENVISFETFFAQHLDPAMKRWRANGVIG